MSNLVISLVLDAVRRSDFKTAKALVKGLDENR